eukprot:COSAG04_NODE_1732_length_5768_cov_11.998236_5_plen_63_part_00
MPFASIEPSAIGRRRRAGSRPRARLFRCTLGTPRITSLLNSKRQPGASKGATKEELAVAMFS